MQGFKFIHVSERGIRLFKSLKGLYLTVWWWSVNHLVSGFDLFVILWNKKVQIGSGFNSNCTLQICTWILHQLKQWKKMKRRYFCSFKQLSFMSPPWLTLKWCHMSGKPSHFTDHSNVCLKAKIDNNKKSKLSITGLFPGNQHVKKLTNGFPHKGPIMKKAFPSYNDMLKIAAVRDILPINQAGCRPWCLLWYQG